MSLLVLSESDTEKLMSSLLEKVKLAAVRYARGADSIRQQIQASGQAIDDKQLLSQYILPHFEIALTEIQQQLFQEYDVDEEEAKFCVDHFIKAGNNNKIGEVLKIEYNFINFMRFKN